MFNIAECCISLAHEVTLVAVAHILSSIQLFEITGQVLSVFCFLFFNYQEHVKFCIIGVFSKAVKIQSGKINNAIEMSNHFKIMSKFNTITKKYYGICSSNLQAKKVSTKNAYPLHLLCDQESILTVNTNVN